MLSKNISVQIRPDEKVPNKETYIIISDNKKKIKLEQKFIKQERNQMIELNYEECERLMNILHHFVFKESYIYKKDKLLIFNK